MIRNVSNMTGSGMKECAVLVDLAVAECQWMTYSLSLAIFSAAIIPLKAFLVEEEALGVAPNLELMAVVALGHPDPEDKAPRKGRLELDELVVGRF